MAQKSSTLLQPADDTATTTTTILTTTPGLDARETVLKDSDTSTTHLPDSLPLLKAQAQAEEYNFPIMDTHFTLGLKLEVGDEFVCGWGAAFINITATFPLNKIMFRQQLHGIQGYKALDQLRREGLRKLYRGLLPPLLLKTTTLSIMFGSYTKLHTALDSSFSHTPQPLNHAMAALLAGTLEATLTPFERIQTLLQDRTYHHRFRNTFHAAVELRLFGFSEYYRGLVVILLRNGPSNVLFFLGKEFVNEHIPSLASESSHVAKDFVCGACLGALCGTVFFPFNVVKTRMQSKLGGPFMGMRQAFREVWVERDRSLSNLYRGVHVNYMRSFISWGIINASYEYLLHLLHRFRNGRL
ncbi:hypothetical protein ACOMHN_063559 [Nucella lapillus]